MNCSSIRETLISIDPNKTTQLWGLAYKDNLVYCDWSAMIQRLVYLEDFLPTLTNPLYQSQLMQLNVDEIFFPLCYAYSVFRIFMVCIVFLYVRGKLKEILGDMCVDNRNVTIFAGVTEGNDLSHSVSVESKEPPNNPAGPRRIRISNEKHREILIYKYTIYLAIIMELVCALRDFVLFRGMLLYTNIMEEQSQQCFINLITNQFTCDVDVTQLDGRSIDWLDFNYDRSLCNCFYFQPQIYFKSMPGDFMAISIILWIITEGMTIGITAFTILTLSRINRKEKSGLPFLKPTMLKSIAISIFCIIFYSIVIFLFELPIYYRFFDNGVVVFYFFWKFMGFILVFDRLYSKIWLEWKLRFQSLHSHGIEWNEHLTTLKTKISRSFGEKTVQVKPQVQAIFEDYVHTNQRELKKIYDAGLNKYFEDVLTFIYSKSIQPYIFKAEREANAKLKTKWYDYLNYMLLMNLIGMFGFGFLVIYGFVDENHEYLFWIGICVLMMEGFTLALIELIVFEISNVIFKLHGFFIELYKNIQLEEGQKDSEQEEDQDLFDQPQQ